MLSVDIEKIIPVTGARDMFNKIVDDVEGSDELYVLTKNGKPAAVVVGVNHLEKLTGETSGEIMTKVDQAKTEPEEDSEVAKPFDTSTTTPPADEPVAVPTNTPATDTFASAPTDTFTATPSSPSPVTPASDFNAAPATADEAPCPMAPVTDGDAKANEPAPTAPASTPTTDPFAMPNTNTSGNQNPATETPGSTGVTPPPTANI